MTSEENQYVWIVNEQLSVGTLWDYASDWESCRLQDLPISAFVWIAVRTHGLQMHKVHVTSNGRNGDDYLHYSLTVLNHTVYAQIDGRA